jgi:hypothetical protein
MPSVSWSTSYSCWFQIHTQFSFRNSISFHSLYMSKPTQSIYPNYLCYGRFFNNCISFFISCKIISSTNVSTTTFVHCYIFFQGDGDPLGLKHVAAFIKTNILCIITNRISWIQYIDICVS